MEYEKLCPVCQSPLVEKSGISKKTGKPYSFVGCSAYPNCDYILREDTPKKTGFQKAVSGNLIVIKELQAFRKEFNDRMDALAEYLANHLK